MPQKSHSPRIAVIGAGIAGLSAAATLEQAGCNVVVYEKNDSVGGRMVTRVKDGLPFDGGALFLSLNYSQLQDYATQFDIPWTPMESPRQHRVLRGGRAYRFALGDIMEVLKLNVLSLKARLQFLRWLIGLAMRPPKGDFFDLSTTSAELNTEDAAHFLNTKVHREVTEYVADPFTGALHFHASNDVSISLLYTFIDMLVRKKNFSARYPKGGIQAIPDALAKSLAVSLNSTVEAVTPTPDGLVRVRVKDGDEFFDAAMLACPAPVAQALLKEPTQAQTSMLSAIRYASTIVLAYKVPVDLFSDNTHGIYVPFVESTLISTIFNEGKKGPAMVKDGMTLLVVYLYDAAAKEMLGLSDEAVAARVWPELEELCPEARQRKNDITLHAVERWPLAMPKFDQRLINSVREFVTGGHQGTGNIFFAGDYLNSPWTEGAARCGKRVAELIRKRFDASTYQPLPAQ